jgi:dihydrofolate synthase/folylpolyglutamate synthase
VPVIVGLQQRDALSVIERRASRLNAPLRIAGEDWTAGEEHGRLVFQDDDGLLDLPARKLAGRHQFDNAGIGCRTLRAIPSLTAARAAFEAAC